MAQLGATIPSQSGPGSNGNEGVLRNGQNPSLTGQSGPSSDNNERVVCILEAPASLKPHH